MLLIRKMAFKFTWKVEGGTNPGIASVIDNFIQITDQPCGVVRRASGSSLYDRPSNVGKLEADIHSTRRGISTHRLDPVHNLGIAYTEFGRSVQRKSAWKEFVPILLLGIVVLSSEFIDHVFHIRVQVSTGGGATFPSVRGRSPLDVSQEFIEIAAGWSL
jgi:hypothetical protein